MRNLYRMDAEAVGLSRKLILLVAPPKGYAHIFDGTRIEWGDLWFRPCDGTWVEVGAALVGRLDSNPSTVVVRRLGRRSSVRLNCLKKKFDRPTAPCDTPPVTKLYNIGAYGIPYCFLCQVRSWSLDLKWSAHAYSEAGSLVRNLRIPFTGFPKKFRTTDGWEVVELEVSGTAITKIVARCPIEGTKWSLVLVIKPDGVVKTCWANLTSDTHRTLDQSKYSKL